MNIPAFKYNFGTIELDSELPEFFGKVPQNIINLFSKTHKPGSRLEKIGRIYKSCNNKIPEIIQNLSKDLVPSYRQAYYPSTQHKEHRYHYGPSDIDFNKVKRHEYNELRQIIGQGALTTLLGNEVLFTLSYYPSCCGLVIVNAFTYTRDSGSVDIISTCLKDAYRHHSNYNSNIRSRRVQAVFIQETHHGFPKPYSNQEDLAKIFKPESVQYPLFYKAFVEMLTDVTFSFHINRNTNNLCICVTGTFPEEVLA